MTFEVAGYFYLLPRGSSCVETDSTSTRGWRIHLRNDYAPRGLGGSTSSQLLNATVPHLHSREWDLSLTFSRTLVKIQYQGFVSHEYQTDPSPGLCEGVG